MSERGTFITEFIYCKECLENAKLALRGNSKELKSIMIPSWANNFNNLPIIAGQIGSGSQGMELLEFEQGPLITLSEFITCNDHCIHISVIGEESIINYKVSKNNVTQISSIAKD